MRDRSIKLSQPSPYRSPALIVVLLAIAVGLVVLDRLGVLAPLRHQAEALIAPALTGLSSVQRLGTDLAARAQGDTPLQAELQALRDENSRLKAEQIRAQSLIQENERLREQLRIEQEQPWQLLGADVSAFSPDPGRHMLLLAVGSEQGVRVGMAVIARDGSSPPALIGVVERVGPHSAQVLLITDFSSSVSAQIYQNDTIVRGLLQGLWQRGSRLQLRDVEGSAQIVPGSVIVTSGLTAQISPDLPRAVIPKQVPIGVVESIQSDGRMQIADVTPFVDPDQVRYAWVILTTVE